MIIDKNPLPDDPTPSEAPPAYDAVQRTPVGVNDNKRLPLPPSSSQPFSSSSGPSSPSGGVRSPTALLQSQPSSSNFKGKGRAYTAGNNSWFNWTSYRTTREVHTTVIGLVKDLVREQRTSSAAIPGILESCAEACSGYDLSLSTILQEKSIENHTPLYWAIVKRPPDGQDDLDAIPDLLTALISYATPLTPETISDVRHACLLNSDQPLFQRLRMSPEFAPLSGTDEMLLGGTIPPDEVTVENMPGDEGAFAVDFHLVNFQKRMLVSKRVGIEFIARARMWKLEFFIADEPLPEGVRQGTWCIALSLLEHSPPSWIDSRLIIPEPVPPPSPQATSPPKSTSPPPASPSSLLGRVMAANNNNNTPKPKPTISIRLVSPMELSPGPLSRRQRRQGTLTDAIIVCLDDNTFGASLQYTGTSYIAPDEILRARLEARLGKPSVVDSDCVIC